MSLFLDFLQELNITELISVTGRLFLIINVVGAIPMIMRFRDTGIHICAHTVTLASFAILGTFLALGRYILLFFGLTSYDFSSAGGAVLLIIGLELVLNRNIVRTDISSEGGSLLAPLTFPIIAGPGTMATLVALQNEFTIISIYLGLVLNLIIIYVVLRWLDQIKVLLGPSLMSFYQKMVGICLLALAAKIFKAYFCS